MRRHRGRSAFRAGLKVDEMTGGSRTVAFLCEDNKKSHGGNRARVKAKILQSREKGYGAPGYGAFSPLPGQGMK